MGTSPICCGVFTTFFLTNLMQTLLRFALAGSNPNLLHPHSEEAEHGSAGSQCFVHPHRGRRQGELLTCSTPITTPAV